MLDFLGGMTNRGSACAHAAPRGLGYNMDLRSRIAQKQCAVGVIGLGYVGLPLALIFSEAGFPVTGFDIAEGKVAQLNAGRSLIRHIPDDRVAAARAAGRFEATGDFSRLRDMDAILICVPTPVGQHREPDLSFIIRTAETIAQNLRQGQLIVLESTTYPGTTTEIVRPILERTGLRCGEDFYLSFSPEREDPVNPKMSTANTPKVVSGVTEPCRQAAETLYGQVLVQVVSVSSPEVAEATKLLENIYRAVNIALVNELKMLFERMGLDVWEVIDAAATKPFGFAPFYPGPGVGGHCIPVDPFYLTWRAREYGMSTRFIELAGEINNAMPEYVVSRVIRALSSHGKALRGARVLVLGVAYKKDVDDLRESPSLALIELLQQGDAEVVYSDPFVPRIPPLRRHHLELESTPLTIETLTGVDCVLIATEHSPYDYEFIVNHAPLVVDTRNATREVKTGRDKIWSA